MHDVATSVCMFVWSSGYGLSPGVLSNGYGEARATRELRTWPAYRLVQELLAAKRGLQLPRVLRKLDHYDSMLIDDMGYLPQGAEESEVKRQK